MRLEAQKFAVYLSIPILASLAFNEPSVQQWAADYFQFMKYPSNPKTNLRDEFEQLQRERDEEMRMQEKRIKGREDYLAQMKLLNASSRGDDENVPGSSNTDSTNNNSRRGWFGWWKRGGEP